MAKQIKFDKLSDFEKEVRRMDPKIKSDDNAFKTGVLLLSALKIGANIERLAKFTGYPKDYIRPRAKLCRENGIFVKGKVSCEWFEENGVIAFWCDVLVAEGLLQSKR